MKALQRKWKQTSAWPLQFHCAVCNTSCFLCTYENKDKFIIWAFDKYMSCYIINVKVRSLHINKKIIYVLENYSANNALRFKLLYLSTVTTNITSLLQHKSLIPINECSTLSGDQLKKQKASVTSFTGIFAIAAG